MEILNAARGLVNLHQARDASGNFGVSFVDSSSTFRSRGSRARTRDRWNKSTARSRVTECRRLFLADFPHLRWTGVLTLKVTMLLCTSLSLFLSFPVS